MVNAVNSCVSPSCLKKIQESTEDHKTKQIIDEHLGLGGTSVGALQSLAEEINIITKKSSLSRKRREKAKEWKKLLHKYENKFSALPEEILNAEKNYLAYNGWTSPNSDEKFYGAAAYKNKKYYEYTAIYEDIKDMVLIDNDQRLSSLDNLVTNYKNAVTYQKKMDELLEIKENENNNLKKALDDMRNATLTNDRRVEYESTELSSLHDTRHIIYYFYYSILIVYAIFGTYSFSNFNIRSFQTWKYIFCLVTYLSAPLWVTFVANHIMYSYNFIRYMFQNRLPRNVYTNL